MLKKLSSILISSVFKTERTTSASAFSSAVLGALCSFSADMLVKSTSGREFLFILPLEVKGISSRNVKLWGTIYFGNLPERIERSSFESISLPV